MKSIIAVAALSALSAPAFAGPYVNIENNAGWVGGEFGASVTETHVGYNFEASENVDLYIQAGPAFVFIEDESMNTEISGKIGVNADVQENLALYAEVALLTEDAEFDNLTVATEVGLKWFFW